MRIWLNKKFGFSKREFNGLLLLIILILLLKLVPYAFYKLQPPPQTAASLTNQLKELTILSKQNKFLNAKTEHNGTNKKEAKRFVFDPNTLTIEGWQSLGLSAKQAQAIINFTRKGGKFFKPEDVEKMYTISPEMYQSLKPYIQIQQQFGTAAKQNLSIYPKAEKKMIVVDINTADSAQLDEIKGVGGAFANRILKYRERLGGFYKKEQLMEVYGIDSLKYAEIKNQITLSEIKLRTINVNTAQFNDFKTNPYLSYKQINAIIQYRKQHGNFSGLADLKKVLILNDQVIGKIGPYLSF